MRLDFPEGYGFAEDTHDVVTIAINRRDFTVDEFLDLVTRRRSERPLVHAQRLAAALGVGCVVVSRPKR